VQEPETIVVRGKDYQPLLGIVAAAALGVSLLCGVGVVGINDINNAVSIGTPTAGIVDFVISNMNTMIVETVQAFSLPEMTNTNAATLAPTTTLTPTNRPFAFKTAAGFLFATSIPPRRTSGPPPPSTGTYTPLPTSTNTPKPTATYTPTQTSTNTPSPTFTDTPTPTDTHTPTPTDTHTPTPTDTHTPTPTDTDVPTPTDTDVPTPTDTPTSGP